MPCWCPCCHWPERSALWGFLAALAVFSLFVILRFMRETYRSALSDDEYAETD
ncbi:hypothetical protein [Streptomyces sp. PU-14G]|uniref:hypothetical protein n=1 Tax=Streptomyces sp. PU-14G TaxID=2800808 RepID=UPI0034DE43B8